MSAQRASQLVEAGMWLRLSGDHAGARRLFEQAIKLDPGNEKARQMLASDPLQQQQAQAPQPPKGVAPLAPPLPAMPPVPASTPWQSAPSSSSASGSPWAAPPTSPDSSGWTLPPPGGPAFPAMPPLPTWPAPTAKPPAPQVDESGWVVEAEFEPLQPAKAAAPEATSAWDTQSNPGVQLHHESPGGDAMDLVAKDPLPLAYQFEEPTEGSVTSRKDEVETLLAGAKDLIDLDDHTGAVDLISKAAELAPEDPRVQKMREKSEATLQTMFESKIGRLDARPKVVLKDDEIIWLNLDHRAGFVLAQIDGSVSFDDIFAVSGMSRLDTARILAQLVDEGVIKAAK